MPFHRRWLARGGLGTIDGRGGSFAGEVLHLDTPELGCGLLAGSNRTELGNKFISTDAVQPLDLLRLRVGEVLEPERLRDPLFKGVVYQRSGRRKRRGGDGPTYCARFETI